MNRRQANETLTDYTPLRTARCPGRNGARGGQPHTLPGTNRPLGSDWIRTGTTIVGKADPKVGPDGLLHRRRHLRAEDLARDLGSSPIRFEKTDAIRAVAEVPSKISLIALG